MTDEATEVPFEPVEGEPVPYEHYKAAMVLVQNHQDLGERMKKDIIMLAEQCKTFALFLQMIAQIDNSKPAKLARLALEGSPSAIPPAPQQGQKP
jgi:hypothetical protein